MTVDASSAINLWCLQKNILVQALQAKNAGIVINVGRFTTAEDLEVNSSYFRIFHLHCNGKSWHLFRTINDFK